MNFNVNFQSLLKYPIKAGLYAGLILISFSALIYFFKVNVYTTWFGLLSMAVTYGILIVFMYKGTSVLAEEALGGKINFFESSVSLFIVGIIALTMSAVFTYFLNAILDPDYLILQLKNYEEYVNSSEYIAESEKANIIKQKKENFDPYIQLISALKFQPFLVIIMSVLMAFFVKKDNITSQN